MKELLVESWGLVKFELLESKGDGRLRAKGEFGFCGKPTANGRIYPRHLIEREIKRLKPKMEARGLYGELDHPTDGSTQLKRASHLITNMWVEADGRVVGEMEVMGTPNGEILRTIVESGAVCGVSSRGVGSVKKDRDGNFMVQEDFRLLTYDAVADPAWGDAIPEYTNENEEFEGTEVSETAPTSLPEDVIEQIRREERERVAAEYKQRFEEQSRQLESKVASGLEQIQHNAMQRAASQLQVEAAGPSVAALDAIKEAVAPLMNLDEEKEQLIERCLIKDNLIESLQAQLLGEQIRHAIVEHSNRVPVDHRERFVALIGSTDSFRLIEDFNTRLGMVVEEFESNGRYFTQEISQTSGKLEEAELRLESAQTEIASRKALLIEAKNALVEMERQSLRRAHLLDEAQREIRSLRAQLDEASEDLAELAELGEAEEAKFNEMLEEAKDEYRGYLAQAEAEKEAVEVELYKHESVIGHASPRQVLERLEDAKTKERVDEILESMRKNRRPVQTQVPVSSNGASDPLDTNSLRTRMEQVLNAKPTAEVAPIIEASIVQQESQGFDPPRLPGGGSFEIPGFEPGKAQKLLEGQQPFIPGS